MANLLTNPNFSAPPLPTSLLIGTGHPGKSAAQSWTTWNNSAPPNVCAYTSTAILRLSGVDRLVNPPHNNPQPFCFGANEFVRVPFQAEQVLEVCTNGSSNGIVQVFAPPNQGPAHTLSSV